MGKWIKLDYDWRDDVKVIAFEQAHGKAALVDVVQMLVLMSRCGGSVDLSDPPTRQLARAVMRMTDTKLDRFVGWCAECGIVDASLWESSRHATSNRAMKDAQKMRARADSAEAASRAAAEKRRKQPLRTP